MRIVAHWVQRALDTLELELQVWVLVPKLGLSARMSSLPVSVLSRLSGACVKVFVSSHTVDLILHSPQVLGL